MKLPRKAFLCGLLTELGGVGIYILGLIPGWGPCGPTNEWQLIPFFLGAAVQLPSVLITFLPLPEWGLAWDLALGLAIFFCQILFWTLIWYVILFRAARTRKVTTPTIR